MPEETSAVWMIPETWAGNAAADAIVGKGSALLHVMVPGHATRGDGHLLEAYQGSHLRFGSPIFQRACRRVAQTVVGLFGARGGAGSLAGRPPARDSAVPLLRTRWQACWVRVAWVCHS